VSNILEESMPAHPGWSFVVWGLRLTLMAIAVAIATLLIAIFAGMNGPLVNALSLTVYGLLTAILIEFAGRSLCLAVMSAIDAPVWLWLTVALDGLSVGCLIIALIWPLPPLALWQAQFQVQPLATMFEFLLSVTGVSLTASIAFQGIATLTFIMFLPQLGERLGQPELAHAARDLTRSLFGAVIVAANGIGLIGLSLAPAVVGVILTAALLGSIGLVLLVIAGLLAIVGLIVALAPCTVVFYRYLRLLLRLVGSVQGSHVSES
jgi:hypothetical protein